MNTPHTETAPVTVNQILERYERECMDELAPRTQVDYRRHCASLRQLFGPLDATQLEPRTFANYQNGPKRGQFERARRLAVLSAAFTIAVRRWFWIKSNVLRDVERPKSKPRDRLISDEEFAACKALAPYRIGLAMQLALLTGQRQGDIIRFRWTNIHEVTVDGRTFSELNLEQSKTGKRMAIEIDPTLEGVLDQCWKLKGSGCDGSEFVLPTKFGRPFTSAGFRASWQRVRMKWERSGGKNLRFHDIRAMAATKCPTLEAAQQLLGHSNPAITRAVYRRGIERVKPLQIRLLGNNNELHAN